MKRQARRLLNRLGRVLNEPLRVELLDALASMPAQRSIFSDKALASLVRMQQLQLMQSYRQTLGRGSTLTFDDIGFDVFSQTNEDGILLYIFAVIGMASRLCVDIGSGGVHNSNAANLIVNHGFSALLVDGNAESVESAREFYAACHTTAMFPPRLAEAFVTAENVNDILRNYGFVGEVDLLCIDIDGNDYWIWNAIETIHPRIVIVEYQDILGPERSWTIPYRADFDRSSYAVNSANVNYAGASLKAFVRLGKSKGYRLVGCNRGGWNAFFLADTIGADTLPEVTIESCFRHAWNEYGMKERFPLVKDMEWQEV